MQYSLAKKKNDSYSLKMLVKLWKKKSIYPTFWSENKKSS